MVNCKLQINKIYNFKQFQKISVIFNTSNEQSRNIGQNEQSFSAEAAPSKDELNLHNNEKKVHIHISLNFFTSHQSTKPVRREISVRRICLFVHGRSSW